MEDKGNQFISFGESAESGRKHSFRSIAAGTRLTVSMCRRLRRGDTVHNTTSYLISSSSSSSSASIAAEIAARCLPWAQRRQLLIYRDRTTEPLTPASTRSIPPSPSSFSLRLTASISFPIDLYPRGVRHRIRSEVDLSLLPWYRTLFARGAPKGSRMGLQAPAVPGSGCGLGYASVYAYARTHATAR